MSRARKTGNLLGVLIPIVGVVVAVVVLWNEAVGALDLGLMLGLYVLTGIGITVGFHRLLTHRAFETPQWVKIGFAVLGSMAVQGPVLNWVADHRKHHAFTDEEGDPHSPHTDHGPGLRGAILGLYHAHVGWLFTAEGRAEKHRYVRDLLEVRGMRIVHRLFPLWVALGLLIPFAIGLAVGGTLGAGLTALLWGGLVRIFLLHHMTFAINSVCHFFGRRRFATDDESRNVFWLALPTFGEAWHHNHHAFPTSAFHGLRRWELDPGGLVVWLLEKAGLAWDVVRVPHERQAAKTAPALAPVEFQEP